MCVNGRWGPYRQASPPPARHRPGARSARREGRRHSIADHIAKDTTMWLRSLLTSLKTRSPIAGARRVPGRPTAARLRIEALEDRSLPSGTVTLASGDDYPLVGER